MLALLTSTGAVPLFFACSGEGETPTCPEQKLYDITDHERTNDPDVEAARNAGIDAGCVTPIGTATSGPAPGSAGSGGSGGTGNTGDAGSAGAD